MKTELIKLLCKNSFNYSKEPVFKLASGKSSQFYINCKPTILSARGMYLVGSLVFDAISEPDIKGIGGLTFGADPISIATSFVSELKNRQINAFSVRKQKKDHGIIKWIEGSISPGEKVVIVDDVATTGSSTIKAIERTRSEGLDVVQAIVLVDRQEGGFENIKKHVSDVKAIVLRDDLMLEFNHTR